MIVGIWLLLACPKALVPIEDSPQHPPLLQVEAPEDWILKDNRRIGDHAWLRWISPDNCCVLTIEIRHEGRRSQLLPLEVLAEFLAVQQGQQDGIKAELIHREQVVIADRLGEVVTLRRHHGPHQTLMTAIYTRGRDRLVILSLYLPLEPPPEALEGWEQVLSSFQLPQDPPPDAPFEPDIPF